MTDDRYDALASRVEELEKAFRTTATSLIDKGDNLLELTRDTHADHRLLLAIGHRLVAQSADPMREVDLIREMSMGALPPDSVPETQMRLERLLAILEKTAQAAVESRSR